MAAANAAHSAGDAATAAQKLEEVVALAHSAGDHAGADTRLRPVVVAVRGLARLVARPHPAAAAATLPVPWLL